MNTTDESADNAARDIKELAGESRRQARRWKAIDEAFKTLKKPEPTPQALHAAVEALATAPLDDDPRWSSILADATRSADRARMKAGMKLGAALQALAEKHGAELTRVSDTPLVFGWNDLQIECDIPTGRARILYGREVCADIELAAAQIAAEIATIDERHAGWRAQPATELFDRIRRAHAMTALMTAASSGERVAIVDLIGPLSNLITAPAQWRKKGAAGLDAYPRERLVVELHHLRRAGSLEVDGLRLELGVASGNSTNNKDDVVFVPSARFEGQYYATLRFVEQ